MSDSPEGTFEERRQKGIWERFDDLDQECRRGHRALRQVTNELEAQADAFELALKELTADVKALSDAPVEATRLRLSPGVGIAIIAATITLCGSVYGIGNRVMNRIDSFEDRMNRQAEADKTDRVNSSKLEDERNSRTEKSIDALTRQMELLKYEQQRLREDVTKPKGQTR